jgi:NAD dependent epimerase/dehydratase family enzyme
MSKHVLLTGGTGLIGKHLTHLLLDQGYTVSHLSRSKGKDPRVKTCLWDISKGQIDEASIDGVDVIVHLAGAGIAEKRWTNTRKKEIVDSRTRSIELIYGLLKEKEHKVHAVISASGISYYGDRDDELLTEDSTAANDFLADVKANNLACAL